MPGKRQWIGDWISPRPILPGTPEHPGPLTTGEYKNAVVLVSKTTRRIAKGMLATIAAAAVAIAGGTWKIATLVAGLATAAEVQRLEERVDEKLRLRDQEATKDRAQTAQDRIEVAVLKSESKETHDNVGLLLQQTFSNARHAGAPIVVRTKKGKTP
jgi:hypothetical protein